MKVSEGYNEAKGYGKVISILTHEREGIPHAINMVFPHKIRKSYEAEIKRLYGEEVGVHPRDMKIHDLTVRKVNKDLTVDLSIDKQNIKLISYTYNRKNLKFNEDLENYYKSKGEI